MSDPELDRILLERAKRMAAQSSKAGDVLVLTASNFDGQINGQRATLVDFWAEWCGPCKMMEPIVKHLADKYSGSVGFGKLNVDEQPTIATRYDVQSIPTFMIFKGGRPIDAVIGAVGEGVLEQRIRKAAGAP